VRVRAVGSIRIAHGSRTALRLDRSVARRCAALLLGHRLKASFPPGLVGEALEDHELCRRMIEQFGFRRAPPRFAFQPFEEQGEQHVDTGGPVCGNLEKRDGAARVSVALERHRAGLCK
jgi:hypothetical protein